MERIKDFYKVKKIEKKSTYDYIENKHYAQRKPSISVAFGLFDKEGHMIGICTFGKPASNSLCIGVCGREKSHKVYELNRLYIDENEKNLASFFVSRCLKYLKKYKMIIVSYSDTGMNHHGYVYQACNFIYTGVTKQRTDKYTEGNRHSRHYTDENNHLRKVRTAKHRYVYFTDKKDVGDLRYEVFDYPKGNNVNYTPGERQKTKIINKITGEEYYI